MGHSAGGLSVTGTTQKFANKIRLAVYVAATMLKLGYSTDQDVKEVSKFFYLWCLNWLEIYFLFFKQEKSSFVRC